MTGIERRGKTLLLAWPSGSCSEAARGVLGRRLLLVEGGRPLDELLSTDAARSKAPLVETPTG